MQRSLSKAETETQTLEHLNSARGIDGNLKTLDHPFKSPCIGHKRKHRIISYICIYEVMLYMKYILGSRENWQNYIIYTNVK